MVCWGRMGLANRQLITYFVGFFSGDFSGFEGLPYLISNHITFLSAPGNKFVLSLGQHKFFVYSQWAAFITAYKLPLLRFIRVLCIVGAAFQASRNSLSLVFMQRNQPCCCHLKPPP